MAMHEKGTFLMVVHVGTARSKEADLTMQLINGHTPAVYCEKTGRTFSLLWQDICNMAMDAGVAEEPES